MSNRAVAPEPNTVTSATLPVIAELEAEARRATTDGPTVRFVPNRRPDYARVAELLEISEAQNQWANGGPLVHMLEAAYADYLRIPEGTSVVACANGGIALEGLARVLDSSAGRRHRWGVSAFTFRNLGRGYFADSVPVDCGPTGMVQVDAFDHHLRAGDIDGIVVTNIFGLWNDFDDYQSLADRHGVPILLDNAPGIRPGVPAIDRQAFSLHHTKPYGVGEGGFAIVPDDDVELFRQLLSYGDLDADAHTWLNNGKLADPSAAYHLDRLERAPEWLPEYSAQAARVRELAGQVGLVQLFDWGEPNAATSMPFRCPRPTAVPELANPHLALGKYYQPLAELPGATDVYRHIINIPTHPDVARLEDDQLVEVFGTFGAPPTA